MEAFSLLKFWRLNPSDTPSPTAVDPLTHAPIELVETESNSDTTTATDSDSDDSFFDLEFTLPGQQNQQQHSHLKCDVVDDSSFPESPNNVFCNSSKPQSPVSFLRSSSPKFSVLMFFKKPKTDPTGTVTTTNPNASPSTPSRFAVKCDVVDEFPIWSVLNRVNSSKTKSDRKEDPPKLARKGGVQRYLKMIKPSYGAGEEVVRVPAADQALARSPSRKQGGSAAAAIRVVSKLGKSRSAAAGGVAPVTGNKSDDSLLLQNDGIQGAILHCKRSLNNSPRDLLSRSRFASEASEESSGSCRNSSGMMRRKESAFERTPSVSSYLCTEEYVS